MVNLVAVLPSSLDGIVSVALALSRPLLEHLHCLVVTLGHNGVLLCGAHDAGSVNLQPRKERTVSTYLSKSVIIMIATPATLSADAVHVFAERAALCSALPSVNCDPRGDSERVRSRG